MNPLAPLLLLAVSVMYEPDHPPLVPQPRRAPPPRRDDWMPEPDDEPDPLLAPHGYGTASLDGGRTLEDIRRERRARSTRVTHRCQWCHSAIVEPLQAEVHDDLGQFGLLVLEASDGPWAWCDRCAMYLDNTGWLAATPMDDANRKRYRRRQRNLWLVERGGLQAVTHG